MFNSEKSNRKAGFEISEEVIASIAVNAAKEVEGVSGFSNHPKNLKNFMKISDGNLKYAEIELTETDVSVHIYVNVLSGTRIPDMAQQVQDNIRLAVQSMTGITVNDVEVTVCSVDFE